MCDLVRIRKFTVFKFTLFGLSFDLDWGMLRC